MVPSSFQYSSTCCSSSGNDGREGTCSALPDSPARAFGYGIGCSSRFVILVRPGGGRRSTHTGTTRTASCAPRYHPACPRHGRSAGSRRAACLRAAAHARGQRNLDAGLSFAAVTGRTRPVLLRRGTFVAGPGARSSGGSPVMAGSSPSRAQARGPGGRGPGPGLVVRWWPEPEGNLTKWCGEGEGWKASNVRGGASPPPNRNQTASSPTRVRGEFEDHLRAEFLPSPAPPKTADRPITRLVYRCVKLGFLTTVWRNRPHRHVAAPRLAPWTLEWLRVMPDP